MSNFYDQEETNVSKHNEASMKMHRIGNLQVAINDTNSNLLIFNQEIGKFNYELNLSCNYSLMMEVYPKLNSDEQDAVIKFHEVIYEYVLSHPVYRSKKARDGGHVTSKTPNMLNFKEIRKRLISFDRLVKMLLEKHKLGSSIENRERI